MLTRCSFKLVTEYSMGIFLRKPQKVLDIINIYIDLLPGI
jgi:hypothetical protein